MVYYIVIAFGVFIFCCIVIIFKSYGEQQDTVQRRLDGIANNFQKSYLQDDELSLPFSKRMMKLIVKPFLTKIKIYLKKKPSRLNLFKNIENDKLKKNIYKAGLSMEIHEYQLMRIVVILGIASLAFLVGKVFHLNSLYCLIAAVLGMYTGYIALRFHLSSRISERRKAMERQLPEVLDLLSINVEAGLGFEQAISHIINQMEGPLIDEMTITYREMSMGRTRRDALLILGERCDINEIKTFVGSIIQAGELGISIRNVLRSQAAAMRQNRRNKIEEKAQKISTKILLPMVLFIFPVIFIILMGPVVVRIIQQFG
ncbi:type II secretion system F family protein [Anaerovorax sp. IOR16]|uniref:type II secretion system F family protein n=1 Tax=Anaerovorax sp. IOR16 TaxID=2773458 RepID=UPI0019CFF24F|nr:type II secretion system F family protein [Anaerovorax sp. IOR16]